ncbi:MAG: hypothetical protein ACYS8L_00975 [Planctomycetota bacterium]
MRIDVDGICRALLAEGVTEADVEDRVAEVCRRLYGDQSAGPTRLVLRAIADNASRSGCTLLEAVRALSETQVDGQATSRRFGSLDEMPPELRARAEKMIESGEHEALTRVVKRRWTPSDGVPSPEVLATVQEQFPGARPEWTGKSLVVRRRSRGKMLLLFLAVLMAGLALLLIRLWVTLRRPSGSRHFGKALQKLEGTFEKDPEDLELGLRLTQAYARKLILVNTLQGMREHGPDPSDELAAQWTASVTQMEKLTGLSGSKEELRETGAKAETLARQLLSRDDLTQSQRSTVLILLGHFLLAQGRTDDALEASREATELHPDDVRPHLLNAAVYETTKEYDRGMRENGQALSKLAAWIREDPTSLHYLVWRAGPDAPPDDPLLRPENVNAGIRQGIEMHNMLLRALAKADDMPR